MLNQLVFLCFLLLKFVEAGRLSFNLKAKPAIQDVLGRSSFCAFLNRLKFTFLDSNKLEPQMDVFGSNVQSALYNMRYYGEVSVGRPPKVFTVIFGELKFIFYAKILIFRYGLACVVVTKNKLQNRLPFKSCTL